MSSCIPFRLSRSFYYGVVMRSFGARLNATLAIYGHKSSRANRNVIIDTRNMDWVAAPVPIHNLRSRELSYGFSDIPNAPPLLAPAKEIIDRLALHNNSREIEKHCTPNLVSGSVSRCVLLSSGFPVVTVTVGGGIQSQNSA